MLTPKQFEQKIKAMSPAEIILAMVDACENPPLDLKVDADSFGEVKNGICVGGIATATIIRAGDITPTKQNLHRWSGDKGSEFLRVFAAAYETGQMPRLLTTGTEEK